MTLPITDAFRFESPLWLAGLAVFALVAWARRRAPTPVSVVPYAAAWHRPSTLRGAQLPLRLAGAALFLAIIALARPQLTQRHHEVKHAGYDIMLCIDLSSSMLSEDYVRDGHRINRLDAVRPVIQAFIEQRPNDRVGVVLFSAKAYTLAPPTLDHEWIERQLQRVSIGLIEDGTAIGDGLGVALTRLEQAGQNPAAKRQGAFIVLLTDGANNCGSLAPPQAASIARARGIPIYTIGAGKGGIVTVPVYFEGREVSERHEESDLDEGALRDIAGVTGGQFYRADATDTIESAFRSIDQTQKIDIAAQEYVTAQDLFPWPAGGAAGLAGWAAVLAAL
ncbi:MAG TPA: VWA domain-containing protein [Opitutaceae bacterium]